MSTSAPLPMAKILAEPAIPAVEKPQPVLRKDRGTVKSVLSGDTIIVLDDKTPTPSEKIITLSSLQAPKMARGAEAEAIFAWESREFLRKKLVGKKIQYAIDHSTATRDYVTVYLAPVGGAAPECVNHSVIAEGWAEVHSKNTKNSEVLLALESEAIQAGKGMHSQERPKPVGKNDEDVDTLYKQLKGKTMGAVVEQARTGSSVRVTILPSRHTFQVLLTGVQSPGWRKKKEDMSAEPQPDPFAREAKFFVENHILQREVILIIDGIAPSMGGFAERSVSFLGRIECDGHDVAEELLKAGLAKYMPSTAAPCGPEVIGKLKAAEKSAQDNRRRLFADFEAKETNGKGLNSEFTGKVISIQNTGAISVIPDGATKEVLVSLSVINTPRPGFPGDEEQDAKEKDKAVVLRNKVNRMWASEGKEFLRKRLLGQKVRVVFDFARKAQTIKEGNRERELPEKNCYSVYHNEQNVALLLAESGFASVPKSTRLEERSIDYEALLNAQTKAIELKRGVHMDAEKVPTKRTNDLCVDSNDSEKRNAQIKQTKPFLAGFERAGPMKAVVDYVFSGARFKVTVPKQSAVFMFSLSGIRIPKRGESAELDDLSNAALNFSREKLHQTEVYVEVNGLDMGGNFVGSLSVNKKNFAVGLLSNGFAEVHYASAERLKEFEELKTAEDSAKSQKLGKWKNYDEEAEKAKIAAAAADSGDVSALMGKSLEVLITEVVDGARVQVQMVGPESAGLEELVTALTELSVKEGGGVPLLTPKAGEVVRAQFSEDGRWYRAKVTEVIAGGKYKVLYIDYGNTETVPALKIRQLPANSDLKALPAQAQLANLAWIKPLKEDNDNAQDARALLRDLVGGRKLTAVVEYKDGSTLYLSLTDARDNLNVAAAMLKEGLARLERSRKRHLSNPAYVTLREIEDKAKQRRAGIWYYGDAPDSDEDEREVVKKGAKPPTGKDAKGNAAAAAPAPAGKKK